MENKKNLNWIDKYRRRKLSEVVGHEKVIKEIVKRYSTNTIGDKPILFFGDSGVGKTMLSTILMAIDNCENPIKSEMFGMTYYEPCGVCKNCKAIFNEEQNVNFSFYDGSEMGKDEVLGIKNKLISKPMGNKYTVIFIDEIHNIAGSNSKSKEALLKVIEKPLPFVRWYFSTMSISQIPKAIKDRCLQFKLTVPDYISIAKYLYSILKEEGIAEDENIPEVFFKEGLFFIARNSNGSIRNAVNTLEKCIMAEIYSEKEISEQLEIVSDDVALDSVLAILKKENSILFDVQKLNIAEFFNLTYSIIKDYAVYSTTGLCRFDFQEDRFKMFKDKYHDAMLELIKTFNEIFESSSYLRNEYFILKLYEYINKKVNKENKNESVIAARGRTPIV